MIHGLLAVALFLLAALAAYGANEKPVNRYKQLGLPVVAFVYCLLVVLLHGGYFAMADLLVGMAARHIGFIASGSGVLVAAVFNCLVIFGFLAFKGGYLAIIKFITKKVPNLLNRQISKYYIYDDDLQHWYLRDSWMGVRRLFRNFYIATLVFASILFLIGCLFPGGSALAGSFSPALLVLVMGEACFCLSGVTKDEYLDDLEFDEDQSERIFHYAKLQQILRHYFGDLLISCEARGERSGSSGTHDDFCQKLIDSERHESKVAGLYFKSLVDAGVIGKPENTGVYGDFNHDLALDTVKLLEGKSVMVASPFYQDYVPYIFLPMVARLMRGGRAALLYGPEVSEETLQKYVHDGIAFVTQIPDMWTVGRVSDDEEKQPDVALIPFSSLNDIRNIVTHEQYFESIEFAIVIDPSSLLATYQIGINFLADYMAAKTPVTYCIFDRNSDGLVDSLSHALRTNLTNVAATEFAEGASTCMTWDADRPYLQHRLLPGVAHYLGVGMELALVALKGQVSHVTWASHTTVPLADMKWIAGQYYGELLQFANLPQEQLQLDEHIDFAWDTWSLTKKNNEFLIVEDENCNLYEAYRQFATRGSQESFVNVLVPNYALRNYMAMNADIFMSDAKAVPSLAPDFSKSQRNVIFSIVMALCQTGDSMSEERILSRLNYTGLTPINVKEALEGLLVDHIDIPEKYASARYEEMLPEKQIMMDEVQEYDPVSREIIFKRYYHMTDAAKYSACFANLRNVPLVTEQPDGTKVILGSRLYGHVYQSFLPGQFISIEGKYYEVVSISETMGVVLRRASDHFSHRRYYRQLREYQVNSWALGENMGDYRTVSNVAVKRINASISVKTFGYLEMTDYGDIKNARLSEVTNIPSRSYRNKSALRLEFLGSTPEIVRTLAVLINEFLVTLYPRDHQYLAAVVPGDNEDMRGVLDLYGADYEDGVIYIIEDSLIDIGLVSSFDRNIQRILELCTDYLDWHQAMLKGIVEEREEYVLGDLPIFVKPEVSRSFWQQFIDRLKKAFAKKKDEDQDTDAEEDADTENSTDSAEPEAHDEGTGAVGAEPQEVSGMPKESVDEAESENKTNAEAKAKEQTQTGNQTSNDSSKDTKEGSEEE